MKSWSLFLEELTILMLSPHPLSWYWMVQRISAFFSLFIFEIEFPVLKPDSSLVYIIFSIDYLHDRPFYVYITLHLKSIGNLPTNHFHPFAIFSLSLPKTRIFRTYYYSSLSWLFTLILTIHIYFLWFCRIKYVHIRLGNIFTQFIRILFDWWNIFNPLHNIWF